MSHMNMLRFGLALYSLTLAGHHLLDLPNLAWAGWCWLFFAVFWFVVAVVGGLYRRDETE